jgi:hypothetical protein
VVGELASFLFLSGFFLLFFRWSDCILSKNKYTIAPAIRSVKNDKEVNVISFKDTLREFMNDAGKAE